MMAEESLAQLVWALFTKDQIEAAVARSSTLAELADDELFASTPGIARSLRALASTKKEGVKPASRGKDPEGGGGEPVSLRTFSDKLGVAPGKSKRKLKKKVDDKKASAEDDDNV